MKQTFCRAPNKMPEVMV